MSQIWKGISPSIDNLGHHPFLLYVRAQCFCGCDPDGCNGTSEFSHYSKIESFSDRYDSRIEYEILKDNGDSPQCLDYQIFRVGNSLCVEHWSIEGKRTEERQVQRAHFFLWSIVATIWYDMILLIPFTSFPVYASIAQSH